MIEAVLQYAARDMYHWSAEQVQAKANEINREFGRFDPGISMNAMGRAIDKIGIYRTE